jgi:hypothetical protein
MEEYDEPQTQRKHVKATIFGEDKQKSGLRWARHIHRNWNWQKLYK